MQPSLRLGRVVGIEIGIHYTWLLIGVLIAASFIGYLTDAHGLWPARIIWSAAIVISVVDGSTEVPTVMGRLAQMDVVIAGEPREWEVVPYVLDSREAGAAKGLIALGRLVSEEPGMKACAEWIRSFVPELPVESVPVGDPYWNPAA